MKKIIMTITTLALLTTSVFAYYSTSYIYDYGNYGTVSTFDSNGNSSWGTIYYSGY